MTASKQGKKERYSSQHHGGSVVTSHTRTWVLERKETSDSQKTTRINVHIPRSLDQILDHLSEPHLVPLVVIGFTSLCRSATSNPVSKASDLMWWSGRGMWILYSLEGTRWGSIESCPERIAVESHQNIAVKDDPEFDQGFLVCGR